MYEHLTLLLSFVFALALTHLLASTTDLVQNRNRVRFSGLQTLWMANALVGLVVNWLSVWALSIIKRWTVGDVLLQFVPAMVQYFTCSLVSMRAEPTGPIDMPAFFERQRPVIMLGFAVMMVGSMVQNYVYRDAAAQAAPNGWIAENLLVAPMLVSALVAAWTKPRWLQWAAGLAMLCLESWFLFTFVVTA